MADLLLTLGHNSSAIVADEQKAIIGYETERITKKKSDSAFPQPVIDRLNEFGHTDFDTAYVTHWEPTNDVDKMAERHWNRSAVSKICKTVISQEKLGLTHHDTHVMAAIAFAGPHFPTGADANTYALVVDGFGNMAEHLSVYKVVDGSATLKLRIFGYYTSIGLMYQYATNFLGMKMHEDEYKLLGYQSKLALLSEYQGVELHNFVILHHKIWKSNIRMTPEGPSLAVGLEALPGVSSYWSSVFQQLLNALSIADRTGHMARIAVAHFVQAMTEANVMHVINTFKPKNLMVSGGVFMNVGLNAMIARHMPTDGLFFAHPLSGDQGNAMGLRFAHTGMYAQTDLRLGKRKSLSLYGDLDNELPQNFVIAESPAEMAYVAAQAISEVGFVNIVRGSMEFGPRALCNTSTIALADDMDIVSEINRINGRNTVMPFAPVMGAEAYMNYFDNANSIWLSDQFMITALDCNKDWHYEGAALLTHDGTLTARPQVIRLPDPVMSPLLKEHEVLINTSFNVHGVPIVLDLEDAIHSHKSQLGHGSLATTIYMDK